MWKGEIIQFILIRCLTCRALKICLDNKIKSEFEQIKNLFLCNGYPEEVIVDLIKKTLYKFRNNIRQLGFFNTLFMLNFFGLDLLANWLPRRFLPLLHAVIMQLCFESSSLLEVQFALFIRMCSLSSNKSI